MKLGAPIFAEYTDPESWVEAVKAKRYGAAFCPLGLDADDATIAAYAEAAKDAGIIIGEVGAFGPNPLASDPQERRGALDRLKRSLDLADRIGARCCVNIAGSRGTKWDGPDPKDLTDETFDMIVDSVQQIIDSVQPATACYTIETMPWMYPDSPDSYVRLIEAIDREHFRVHFDPVNIVSSPQLYFNTDALLRDSFDKLGHLMMSCHAKDIKLQEQLTVHLDEVGPGLGNLDYRTFLTELDTLEDDVPLLIEHLPDEDEYDRAAEYIRSVAHELSLNI